MDGSFDISFGEESGSYKSDAFVAEYCNNLVRN